jgi:hypothetical protein
MELAFGINEKPVSGRLKRDRTSPLDGLVNEATGAGLVDSTRMLADVMTSWLSTVLDWTSRGRTAAYGLKLADADIR